MENETINFLKQITLVQSITLFFVADLIFMGITLILQLFGIKVKPIHLFEWLTNFRFKKDGK